jgi:hypothetical protein
MYSGREVTHGDQRQDVPSKELVKEKNWRCLVADERVHHVSVGMFEYSDGHCCISSLRALTEALEETGPMNECINKSKQMPPRVRFGGPDSRHLNATFRPLPLPLPIHFTVSQFFSLLPFSFKVTQEEETDSDVKECREENSNGFERMIRSS